MQIDWKHFKRNPLFFWHYFFWQMVSSLMLVGGLLLLGRNISFAPEFANWHFVLVPFAIVLGVQLPAVLHNAVHFNMKPRWLNDIIGELAGLFVLFGLGPFRISHFMHHAFADTDWDTHPPEGKGFLYFLATTQINTIMVIRRKFLQIHGNNVKTQTILMSEMAFYYVSLVARVAFWMLLLGPELFVVLYLPAYITNVLVFAHINYATHAEQPDGSTEILNLDSNWYYRAVNFIGSGVYFHANHHRYPNLYNPMKAAAKG